uniref:FHA domain-containing protein n=1 Tax=Salix viminalis TaxID=40686 RepID=A0A6N2KH36_SALVM
MGKVVFDSSQISITKMEIEGEEGTKIEVGRGSKTVFGRGYGLITKDRRVSRRHIIFELDDNQTASFQVVGKNPVCVRSGEENVKIFRRLEKGVVAAGDWFCISSQNPVRFCLKEKIGGRRRVQETDNGNWDSERFDLSKIDPVKEFGFLVIGHELDCYPKHRIKDARSWDWFLELPEQDSEGGESSERKKKNGRGKRKKKAGESDGDGDWSGESEDDEVLGKIRKVDRPKYSTRSKERDKPRQDTKRNRVSAREINEDDETLGGFIVDDDDKEEEQGEEGDEEEEDFDDDDDQ